MSSCKPLQHLLLSMSLFLGNARLYSWSVVNKCADYICELLKYVESVFLNYYYYYEFKLKWLNTFSNIQYLFIKSLKWWYFLQWSCKHRPTCQIFYYQRKSGSQSAQTKVFISSLQLRGKRYIVDICVFFYFGKQTCQIKICLISKMKVSLTCSWYNSDI